MANGNNTQQVSVALAQTDLPEGNTGDTQTRFDFVITRSGATDEPLDVNWEIQVAGADPAEITDFASGQKTSDTVSFAADQEQQTVSVLIARDLSVELDEQFALVLDANGLPEGTTLGTASAVATISNDDPTVTISPSLAQAFDEGDPGGSPATFSYTLTRDGDLSEPLTVNWAVAPRGNFAVDEQDFVNGVLPSGQVTFAADQAQAAPLIEIEVNGDTDFEPDEQFQVDFSLPDNAPAGTLLELESVNGTIRNDDAAEPPVVSIAAANAEQAEGNTGDDPATEFTFTVTRSGDPSVLEQASTVDWAVEQTDGPTVDGADFVFNSDTSGTVEFAAGETERTITLQVNGDQDIEPNEGFQVTLSAPDDANATIGQATATGIIENDDAALPQVSITGDDSFRPEGNGGDPTPFTFIVSRQAIDLTQPTIVDYEVIGRGDDPAEPDDFDGGVFPSGKVTIKAGERNEPLTINVAPDTTIENDEGFEVVLSNPVNGIMADGDADGLIRNDDIVAPTVSLDSVESKLEGNEDSTVFNVTLSREGDLSRETTFELRMEGSGTDSVDADDFINPILPFTVTGGFEADSGSVTVPVRVRGDAVVEPDETFTVQAAILENGTLDPDPDKQSAQATVFNDDQQVSVALSEADKAEGNPGEAPMEFEFVVTRTGKTDGPLDVNWSLEAATENSAGIDDLLSDQDLSGVVTFAADETQRTVSVGIAGDLDIEPDERFSLVLDGEGLPPGTTLGTVSAEATIANDDTSVLISPSFQQSKDEGDPGDPTTIFEYTLTRKGDLSQALTVNWTLSPHGDDQVSADDFAGGSLPQGQVSFAARAAQARDTIRVEVNPDTSVEPDEDFVVNLTLPDDAPAGTRFVVDKVGGTIKNDDAAAPEFPVIGFDRLTVAQEEGDSLLTRYTFTVNRSGDDLSGSSEAQVQFDLGDTNRFDYVSDDRPDPEPVVFGPGEESQTVDIWVKGDLDIEDNEMFTVSLVNEINATIDPTASSATGTIINDDSEAELPVIAFAPDSLTIEKAEGNVNDTEYTFTLNRTGETGEESSVEVVFDAGDTDANDFAGGLPAPEPVVFNPGEKFKEVTITVAGDREAEPDEMFTLRLQNEDNATIDPAASSATGTILDDDSGSSEPTIGFDPPEQSEALKEGSSGQTDFEYTLKRSGDLSEKSIALVQLTHGTTQDTDFSGNDAGPFSVIFEPDQESATLTVKIKGEETAEEDETFELTITHVINGVPDENASTASGTILDDDTFVPPVLSIGPEQPVEQPEGDVGTTTFTFTVTRTGDDLSREASVQWSVFPDGDNPAGPEDFANLEYPSDLVEFDAGQTEPATIEVVVQGDNVAELAEGFTVALLSSSASGATVDPEAATASGTILDDDADDPVVAIVAVEEKEEGSDGSTPFLVTLSRTGDLTKETPFILTVDRPESGDDSVDRQDFADGEPLPFFVEGRFPAVGETGEQTVAVPIDVAGDLSVEFDERFTVTVTVVQNGQIDPDDPASATGEGTIINDDYPPPVVSIEATGADQLEGNTGDAPATEFTFTVTREGDPSVLDQASTVNWAVEQTDAPTVDGADFVFGSDRAGTVEFQAGETERTITLQVNGDQDDEDNEGFQVTLSAPDNANATIDSEAATALGTIQNDDGPVVVSIEATDADKLEGNAGAEPATEFTFTVSHAGDTSQDVNVTWQGAPTGDDPADIGDFDVESGQGLGGTVIIPAGQNSAPLIVPVLGDTALEADETFLITLTDTPVGDLDPNLSSATGTILDDERIRGTDDGDIITPDGVSDGVIGGEPSDADDVIDARGGPDIVDGGGADIIDGGSGNDTLEGGIGIDQLWGGDDNDTLRGQEDDDVLLGQAGSDVLEGGPGNDALNGGAGNDTLTGGDGVDRYVFSGSGADTITDFTVGSDVIDLSAYGLSGIGDLSFNEDGSNTIITGYGGDGDSITLENVDPDDLGPEDFILTGPANVFPGTDSGDYIFWQDDLTPGNDVVKALAGDDIVDNRGGRGR